MTDGPQPALRRKDDSRYMRLERRMTVLERRVARMDSTVEHRLDRLETRVAFASGAVAVIVVITGIIGPVAVQIILKITGNGG